MQFYVEGYDDSHGILHVEMNVFPHVKLVTDNYDDFGYETLFRMYYKKDYLSSYDYIGKVKILHVSEKITRFKIDTHFENLKPEFCSLGQSIDYYQSIKKFNRKNKELGREILDALNDIAIFPSIEDDFANDAGIINSLLRDSESFHAYKFGHNTFYNKTTKIMGEVSFTFTYNKEYAKEVSFIFNDNSNLPSRINVIVGKNGTGKTEILSTLASVLSGYSRNENCKVSERPEFSRYIAVSYSAFDNFDKPFENELSKKDIIEEKNRIYSDIRKLTNKCEEKIKGKKDDYENLYNFFYNWERITKEYEEKEDYTGFFESLVVSDDEFDVASDNQIGSYVYCGLKRKNKVITEDEMFELLVINFRKIINKHRIKKWEKIVTEIFDDEERVKSLFEDKNISFGNIIKKEFFKLSSGQKIVLHIFTEVIESITEDSLLLIDEPEIHLHPNAISNFMRVLNKLLIEFNSFSVISTHSPIILQEVPSRYIRIFDNNSKYDTHLYDECFGETISKIISNVFDVRADESNYKNYFLEKKNQDYSKSDIEGIFNQKLSFNAKLYLNYLYENKVDK